MQRSRKIDPSWKKKKKTQFSKANPEIGQITELVHEDFLQSNVTVVRMFRMPEKSTCVTNWTLSVIGC